MEVDEVLHLVIAQVLVDDPVHQLEAGERHGEDDAGVLVNVRRRHPKHLVQLLHVALRVGRRRTRRTGRARRSAGRWPARRRRRHVGRRRPVVARRRTHGRPRLLVVSSGRPRASRRSSVPRRRQTSGSSVHVHARRHSRRRRVL